MSEKFVEHHIRYTWRSIYKMHNEQAIKAGGTTIKDHMQPDGSLGYFKQRLRVYGRSGYKCIMCKATIKEIKQSGRTSFYCGVCQR